MTASAQKILVSALGVETRAWVYGDGVDTPVVLVHGFRGDHHGLHLIATHLCEMLPGRRVIVPDLPGFGETPPIPGRTHDLDAYAEWLGIFVHTLVTGGGADLQYADGTFDLLGHSFGSLIVARAVARGLRPGRTILINPISAPALQGPNAAMTTLAVAYYRLADALAPHAARHVLGHPLIVRVMSEVMAKTRDRKLRRWIHDQHAKYFSVFADTTTLLEAFEASVSHTVADFSAALTMPTLIVAGDRDDIAPLTGQVALRHRLTDAQLRIIPGVGHLVHYEAPVDAAAYTARFLSEARRHDGGAVRG